MAEQENEKLGVTTYRKAFEKLIDKHFKDGKYIEESEIKSKEDKLALAQDLLEFYNRIHSITGFEFFKKEANVWYVLPIEIFEVKIKEEDGKEKNILMLALEKKDEINFSQFVKFAISGEIFNVLFFDEKDDYKIIKKIANTDKIIIEIGEKLLEAKKFENLFKNTLGSSSQERSLISHLFESSDEARLRKYLYDLGGSENLKKIFTPEFNIVKLCSNIRGYSSDDVHKLELLVEIAIENDLLIDHLSYKSTDNNNLNLIHATYKKLWDNKSPLLKIIEDITKHKKQELLLDDSNGKISIFESVLMEVDRYKKKEKKGLDDIDSKFYALNSEVLTAMRTSIINRDELAVLEKMRGIYKKNNMEYTIVQVDVNESSNIWSKLFGKGK